MRHQNSTSIKAILLPVLLITAMLLSSCSIARDVLQGTATNTPEPATEVPAATEAPTTAPTDTQAAIEPPTATVEPSATPIAHVTQPEEFADMGSPYYDVESSGTGLKHYAPFGDVYELNRFERPFTANDMVYQSNLDISQFNLVTYGDWNYAFIKTIGAVPHDDKAGNFGVEIDIDRDGFGEYLIMAKGPFTTTWTLSLIHI